MADSLAQAYVQIIPTTKGIKGNLQKELGSAGDTAGNSAGGKFSDSFKQTMKAAAIGTAIVTGISKSISQGAALEQSIGGIRTIFKRSANEVIKNADSAFERAGISANTYMEQATSFSASLLQAVGKDTKAAAKYADMAIIDMSDNANKMGTNIVDIQNAYQGFAKQNYTMLDNLKLGYGGTKTEMERLLKDASKLSGQDYDISNLADVYQAINVIQKEMKISGTSADEAATTISGSFNAMKAAADNFMGNLTLGRNISSSMNNLATTASTFLFNNLVPALGNILTSLPAALGTFIKSGVPEFMAKGQEMLNAIAKGFGNTGDFIKKALSGLSNMSGLIKESLPKLAETGVELLKNLAEGIAEGLPDFIENAPTIIADLADGINDSAPKLLKGGLTIIKALALGIIKSIPVLIKSIPKIFKALLKAWEALNWLNLGKLAMSAVKKGITSMISPLASTVKTKFTVVKNAITSPIATARKILSGIISRIRSGLSFSGLAGKVSNAFRTIKSKITSPITNAWNAVKGVIAKIKGLFPLKLGRLFSSIKLPHFKITGKFPWGFGGKGVEPGISVKWYKTGGIFSDPSVIGVGEAGSEAVVPLATLWKKFDALTAAVGNGSASGSGTLNLTLQLDGKTIGRSTVDYINGQTLIFGTNPIL